MSIPFNLLPLFEGMPVETGIIDEVIINYQDGYSFAIISDPPFHIKWTEDSSRVIIPYYNEIKEKKLFLLLHLY